MLLLIDTDIAADATIDVKINAVTNIITNKFVSIDMKFSDFKPPFPALKEINLISISTFLQI